MHTNHYCPLVCCYSKYLWCVDIYEVHLIFFIANRHVDANKTRYIETLREAVAIKSVSAWPNTRNEVQRMVDWTAEKLKALGAQVEQAELGTQTLPDGQTLPLPKAILGVLGNVSIDKTNNIQLIKQKANFNWKNKK